jgi:hypothetical protein
MIYSGPIEAGQMHGRGKITYNNGESYEGDIYYGKRQGKVTYTLYLLILCYLGEIYVH